MKHEWIGSSRHEEEQFWERLLPALVSLGGAGAIAIAMVADLIGIGGQAGLGKRQIILTLVGGAFFLEGIVEYSLGQRYVHRLRTLLPISVPQRAGTGIRSRCSRIVVEVLLTSLAGVWLVGTTYRIDPNGFFGVYSLGVFAANVVLTYAGFLLCYVVLGGQSWRGRSANAMLAFVTPLLCLVVLELPVMFRLLDYRLVFSGELSFRRALANPRNRLDPELISIHHPYDRFSGSVPGDLVYPMSIDTERRYTVDVRYDRNGFRNASEIDAADIVILGDSFVEGAIVPYEAIVSSRLSETLGVTVLNLGHASYGPQQGLIALRRYGLDADPKIVVWLVFEGNDLTEDYRIYEEIVNDWDGFVSRYDGFAERSFTWNALHVLARLTRGHPYPQLIDPSPPTLRVPGEHSGERIYMMYESHSLRPEDLESLAGAQQVIEEAYQLSKERGSEFLLAFVPIKYRVYHDLVDAGPDSKIAGWRVTDLAERMATWCRSAGIPFLDLTPALRSAAASGKLVYLLDDSHWAADGHAVAAREIAGFLRQAEWLESDIVNE